MSWGDDWSDDWGGSVGGHIRMQPTTPSAIREDFIETIRQITPTHPRFASPWLPVEKQDHVPGTDPRLYYVMFGWPAPVTDGIFGDGMDYELEAQIWTNYSGLPDEEVEGIIAEDGRQLYIALEARTDPVFPGLHPVTYLGFFAESDEPGAVHGYHSLQVRYLASDQ
jgi:hypothetical protein